MSPAAPQPTPQQQMPSRYRERLSVPPVWWALALLMALTCGVVVGFYLGPLLGITVGVLVLAAGLGLLICAGIVIEVDDRQLRVGRAMIEFAYLGSVQPLEEAAAARRTGPGADARAYLVLRPYIRTAVEIAVADDADPAPYWLISTRRPAELAAALDRASLG